MRARDIVGRKIVSVKQLRYKSVATMHSIELDNGKRIYFHAEETDDSSPVVTVSVVTPPKRRIL